MKKTKFLNFELVTPLEIDFVTRKKIKQFLCMKFNVEYEKIIGLVLR